MKHASLITLVLSLSGLFGAGVFGCNGSTGEPAKLPGGGVVKDGRGNVVNKAAADNTMPA